MVSKKLALLLAGIALSLPMLGWTSHPDGTETVADLSAQQQAISQLKVAIERLKLQRERDQLTLLSGAASEICRPTEGVGPLTLNTIYGVEKTYAVFSYSGNTQVEAIQGGSLLCGEKVVTIALDHAVVEKQGQRYLIAGSVMTVPQPAIAIPSAKPLLVDNGNGQR